MLDVLPQLLHFKDKSHRLSLVSDIVQRLPQPWTLKTSLRETHTTCRQLAVGSPEAVLGLTHVPSIYTMLSVSASGRGTHDLTRQVTGRETKGPGRPEHTIIKEQRLENVSFLQFPGITQEGPRAWPPNTSH